MRATGVIGIVLVAILGAQIGFAITLRHAVPHRDLLPPLPTEHMAAAQAFGDRQFYFRTASLDLQDAGDTGGRIVPIKNYDYGQVLGWLRLLQGLDPRSIIPVSLASGIFGQSQDLSKVPPIIAFIRDDVARDPAQRWKHLYEAIFLAEVRLHDRRLGLEAAQQLSSYGPDVIPQIAALTPAFILEQRGELQQAHAMVEDVRRRYEGRVTPDEQEWSLHYLNYLEGREPRPK